MNVLEGLARQHAEEESERWIHELFELGWTVEEVYELIERVIDDREDAT